jgi:diguanylate cyclase (GGDEF)-like protein
MLSGKEQRFEASRRAPIREFAPMRRIILLLDSLALLAVIAGASLYYRASYHVQVDNDYALAREELLRLSDYVEQQSASRRRGVAALAVATDASAYLERPTPAAQAALISEFRALREALNVTTIYLLNAEGETVASSNAGELRSFMGENLSFRPYFQQAIAGKPAQQIAMGKISKVVGTYFSHPVFGSGSPQGVLVVRTTAPPIPLGVLVVKAPLDVPQLEAFAAAPQVVDPLRNSIMMVASPEGNILATNRMHWKNRQLPVSALHGADNRQLDLYGEAYSVVSQSLADFPGWKLVRLSTTHNWTRHIWAPLFAPTGLLYLLLLIALAVGMAILNRTAAREVRRRQLATLRLQRSRARYRKRSEQDALTGLYNRGRYDTDLVQEIQRSERYSRPLSMALLDLDHFKKINDLHGHHEGDRVLRLIALLIKENLRGTDSAYRMGGEEFLILLPETESDAAEALTARLHDALRGQSVVTQDGETLKITFSCAVVTYRAGEGQTQFFRRADDLLYEGKASGRNRILVAR